MKPLPKLDIASEWIAPKVAEKYLATNRSNRPLSARTVSGYVQAMLDGEWLLNGEAIKFDFEGYLVDGQHRLAAVVKSGKAMPFVVIRGLDPEVFKTLDTGRVRSSGDVLAIRGIKNPNAASVALRQLYRVLHGELQSKKRITNSQLDDLLAGHPRFQSLAEEADHAPYAAPKLLPPGQMMFAFYVACHVDEKRARLFFRALAGRPEPADVAQFQAVKLRERLTAVMDEIIKPSPKVRLAWVIEAWNKTLEGRPVDRFSRIVTELPEWDPEPSFFARELERRVAGAAR